MSQEKLISLLTLKKAPNLGDASIKKMIRAVGSAEGVLKESASKLLKIDGIGSIKIKEIHNPEFRKAAEQELAFVQANNIKYSIYDEEEYPEKLRHCLDGPLVLFSRGNIALKNRKIISIVGTRKVTSYGREFCKKLIETLAPMNPIIVSGFAYGVDIIAHKNAIKHRLQTIGCLAHGLNQIYPRVHAKYMEQVEENGGFFTDYWSTDTFDRNNFLGRNRIIAGLSEATIVIESAEKGGSLVTAEIANSYNRDVFAVPGRANDKLSTGCNTLIKTQKAHMLTSAADLVYMLNWDVNEKQSLPVQKKLFVELDKEEQKIYNFLVGHGKELLDGIALQCNIPTHKVASILLTMELKGVIKPLPGKLFEVI